MNRLQDFQADQQSRGLLSNELDSLLRRFFLREMPERFPDWQAPAASPLRSEGSAWQRHGLKQSRFALAASLLLLLVGAWAIPGLRSESGFFPGDSGPAHKSAQKESNPAKPRWKLAPAADPAVTEKGRLSSGSR